METEEILCATVTLTMARKNEDGRIVGVRQLDPVQLFHPILSRLSEHMERSEREAGRLPEEARR